MKFIINVACFFSLFIPVKMWGIIEVTGVIHNSAPNTPFCTNGNGSIDITAQGNAGPFTYVWSNGQTTEDIDHLCASMYTVTVTNAFGCSKVLVAAVYDCNQFVPPITLSNPIITPISIAGATDGAIDITASGGFGNLYYKWTNQATGEVIASTQDIHSLPAGTYCVQITGGCTTGVSECYKIVACSVVS